MRNNVTYALNALDDAAIELWTARNCIKEIHKEHGRYSEAYAESLSETIDMVKAMVESIKEQVGDSLQDYVEDDFPIKEEDE